MIGIGRALQEARLNQGFSIEEMNRKTNIQSDYLTALEDEEFRLLPSPFYARGFLRAYARSLKLNPQHLLELYEVHVMKRELKRQEMIHTHSMIINKKKQAQSQPHSRGINSPEQANQVVKPSKALLPRKVAHAERERQENQSTRFRKQLYWILGTVLVLLLIAGLIYRFYSKSFA